MTEGSELAGRGMELQHLAGRTLDHLSIKSGLLLGFALPWRGQQDGFSISTWRIGTPILLLNIRLFGGLTHNYPLIDTQPLRAVRAADQVQCLVGRDTSFHPICAGSNAPHGY